MYLILVMRNNRWKSNNLSLLGIYYKAWSKFLHILWTYISYNNLTFRYIIVLKQTAEHLL